MKIILILIIILSAVSFAQNGLMPDEIVRKYFEDRTFAEKGKYLADEMLGHSEELTIGEELAGSAAVNFYPVQSGRDGAVFNINIKKDRSSVNFYCYLVNEDGWKISAIRNFILPRYIYSAMDSLSGLKNPEPKDETLLKTLQLITCDDQELKNYLTENLSDFKKLVQYYKSSDKVNADILMHKLGIGGTFEYQKFPGSVFISIGSAGSSEAGYIYSESGKLPVISPDNFIYIEQVVSGWYVYRLI